MQRTRAARICRRAGAGLGLVDLGGDIAVIGPHPDGSPWRIGVRNPLRSREAVATLFVDGGRVATSGDYERYQEISGRRCSHVFDPKTGRPVESLPSVTVVAKTCLSAGVTSTIALLKGEAAPQRLNAAGAHHLYVEPSGNSAVRFSHRYEDLTSKAELVEERNCAINCVVPWTKFCWETSPELFGLSASETALGPMARNPAVGFIVWKACVDRL